MVKKLYRIIGIIFLFFVIVGAFNGCKKIDIKPETAIKIGKKIDSDGSITGSILKSLFDKWKIVSGVINIWYDARDLKYEKELQNIKNKDVSWMIKHSTVFNNVKYESEEKDIIYLPKTTYRRGSGDCEDLAYLITYVLGDYVYDNAVKYTWDGYYVGINESSHVVSVYRSNTGSIIVFSNTHYDRYENIEIFNTEMKKDYYAIVKLDKEFNYVSFYLLE